jgi:enoyl-CoA hydratase/carnithine racemase
MSGLVEIRREGHVVELTLNDPQRRNPLSNAMIDALLAALVQPDVASAGMIVLRGAGKDFCAGGDINDFRGTLEMSAVEQWETGEQLKQLMTMLRTMRPVLVAAVNGRALGGGCGLVASCDFAIASASTRFGTPEIKLGAFPMIIVPALLEAIGPRKTMQLASLGQLIDAAEALVCGLVQQVVPDEDFDTAIDAFLVAARAVSPDALRIGKACVWNCAEAPRNAGLELGVAMRALLFSSREFGDGVRKFLDRD